MFVLGTLSRLTYTYIGIATTQNEHTPMSDKPSHRPPLYGEKMDRTTISLPKHLKDFAEEIGDSMSDGIRRALEAEMKRRENVQSE
jgi:hypothetical protein